MSRKRSTAILIFILFLFSGGFGLAQEGPIGWASLNGGTTGGEGGETVQPTSRAEFFTYVNSSQPYIVQVRDTIELALYERIQVKGDKTIIGLGEGGTLLNGGLEIVGNNVILRNLRITGSYDGDWDGKTNSTDAITIFANNVWVDHCDLSASADGLLDFRTNGGNQADYVTVSWTRFSNHNKVMLFGGSEDEIAARGHFRTTIHHSWFDGYQGRGVNQRMPMIRFADVHLFNNYYDEIDSYCVGARIESDVVVERNYFRNSHDPHKVDDQGKGLEDPDLVAIENVYDFTSGLKSTHGNAFVPSDFYEYTADEPSLLPEMVMNGAGLFNNPGNHEPLAVHDTLAREVEDGRSAVVDVLANDVDEDGDSLRLSMILDSGSGLARIVDNKIQYIAPSDPEERDTVLYQLVDTKGGIDTAMLFVHTGVITRVNEVAANIQGLSVFPNPAKGSFTLEFSHHAPVEYGVQLFDLSGKSYSPTIRRMASLGGSTSYKVITQGLPSGLYLVSLANGKHRVGIKVSIVN